MRSASLAAAMTAVLADPPAPTTMDADGAVRSLQAAELAGPPGLATPAGLARLERLYWRTIIRATLGLVRPRPRDGGCELVLLARPLVLMAFGAPVRSAGEGRAEVRFPLTGGLLLARGRARAAGGELRLRVRARGDGGARVEVEVEGYRPALAAHLAPWLYRATQARVHVLVTHGFLRRVARLSRSARR